MGSVGKKRSNLGNANGSHKEETHQTVLLPEQNSKIKHIFGDREGHMPDTPQNRQILIDLANDQTYYIGTDKYGNAWNVQNVDSGQYWVEYRDNTITEGGFNSTPRKWDPDTGLNKNPFKKGK